MKYPVITVGKAKKLNSQCGKWSLKICKNKYKIRPIAQIKVSILAKLRDSFLKTT